tara:strand:- start:1675 stop:2046 length:372 start_codon:yes stop_codon:yes gene_type:complete
MTYNRPLSPHLSIHKKVLTSVFSILHRITGIGLTIGTLLISIWISLLALGADYFYIFKFISTNIIFKFFLFIWTVAIFYHLFNGVRYLFWSFGLGMDLKTVYFSSYFVLIFTLVATFGVWFIR